MVSNSLVRRISTSELSLLRSPVSQVSTLTVDERRNKQAVVTSPKNKVSDNGKFQHNFNIKERLQNLRSRSFLQPQQQQQQQQQQQTPTKRITFSMNEPECFAVCSRADFSLEECRSYWVQPEETQASIDRNWTIIDAYEKSKKNKESKFPMCTRGLESYMLERQRGKKIHATKQQNARMAVLLWGRGLSDEERARRYRLVSKRCVKRALEYARRDAITARRILTEDAGALSESHSQHSDQSCSSSVSTRSDLDLPCVPKSRKDAWTRHSDKKKKKKKGQLRSCLKQATGTIPEILPVIYVRTRKIHVSDQRKGRSKTRLSSKNRTGESEGNRNAATRRSHSTCSTLVVYGQLQRSNSSSSLPCLPLEFPHEEDHGKQTQEDPDTNSTPDEPADRGLNDEIQLSREAVITRLIHNAYPRCPRPSHLEYVDDPIDASSPSVTTNLTSVVRVKASAQATCSNSL